MPKKFSFKLESLLNLRSHKVEQEKNALMQIQAVRIAKENEIKESEMQLEAAFRNKTGKTTIEMLQIDYHRQIFMKDKITSQTKELNNLLEIEKRRREILNEAMKEEKVLEKLKEKQFEEYKFELNREENAFMDEIVNNKEARKMATGEAS